MTETAKSADGTVIAYQTWGSGPAVLLVRGAFNTRLSPEELAEPLAGRFTVYSYDRRGRGDSGDTKPYAIERELEDLRAVIDAAGGSAMVYGHSSGAILTLLAAAAGAPITRIAAYEPPFTADPDGPPLPDSLGPIREALAAGDREKAVELFMAETGQDDAAIAAMKKAPFWPGLVAMADTAEYDMMLGGGLVPADVLSAIRVPTLVLDGGDSADWAARASEGVVAAVSGAQRRTVAGQGHAVDQRLLAPILVEWFSS